MALLSRLLLAAALLAAAFFTPMTSTARAQSSVQLLEQDIKAGLLYNFLRYTDWPPRHVGNGAAVVCVLGADPFSGRLAPMAGRTVNQRVIQVRTVSTTAEFDACSLLYINAQERARWPEMRTYLAQRDVLTVSDFDGFARSGGMIEFTHTDNRIGVRINTDAVSHANLSVEDRLLRLATPIHGSAP